MVASIAAVHDNSESQRQLQTLQEENFLLKQQLSKSMTSMISTGKVSVTSAEKGDIVLVVWSEEHSNYQIYHEVKFLLNGQTSLFLTSNLLSGFQPSLPSHRERGGARPQPHRGRGEEETRDGRGGGQGVLPGQEGGEQVSSSL